MLADLGADADGLLLFTYAAGDLDNPAVVQNAYTKEVVLPPTNRNARIFGNAERPDKVAGADDAFNTLARTPFVLKGESGEVLESGYVKLEESSEADGYRVTLYGGLGSFLYGLMYGEDGSKKSLASLTWGATIDAGLSFAINATRVQSAWDYLHNTYAGSINSPHAVVNFAPMHNGRPTDFDCNKGMIPVGGAHGCPAVPDEFGRNGYALAEFGREFNEWEVRDLRSYLQRPVFNIRALLSALADVRNNGGYAFDWSAIADKWYADAWMTLPMLDTLAISQQNKTLTLTWDSEAISHYGAGALLDISIAETLPSAGKVSVELPFRLERSATYYADEIYGARMGDLRDGAYIFVRLIGYDSSNNEVCHSKVRCICGAEHPVDPSEAARNLAGVQPVGEGLRTLILGAFNPADIEMQLQGGMAVEGEGYYTTREIYTDTINLKLEGYGIHHLGLAVQGVQYYTTGGYSPTLAAQFRLTDDQPYEYSAWVTASSGLVYPGTAKATYDAAQRVRSGSYITKDVLLGGTASPAELLLGLVKTFGLVLAFDGITRTIKVLERDGFYTGETIDLTARIDRSQPVRVVPNGITEKWLEFAHGTPQGAKAEAYAKKYGAQYGAQKVNTGSPYNAETLQVLDGTPFVAGLTGLAYSRYFCLLTDSNIGSGVLPSAYLDNNCKYYLWNASDEAQEHAIASCSEDLDTNYINGYSGIERHYYDGYFRLQIAGEDDAAASGGAGILLLRNGSGMEYAHLTDDDAAMLGANNGRPCWIPCLDSSPSLRVPQFCTYVFGRSWGGYIEESLDFGMPRELDMPAMNYGEGLTIYERCWQAYIRDRYSENAHRVTARVDLRGMQVGQALLGNFFYFDGCVWVLEKITDWCWDMQEPCECVFVRVLDKGAYTNGQN